MLRGGKSLPFWILHLVHDRKQLVKKKAVGDEDTDRDILQRLPPEIHLLLQDFTSY